MISHGIVSGALFLCVGVVYDRMHTREIAAYGGLVNRMPLYAAAFMVFTLANVGLPGTSGFVGEFLTLVGAFKVNTWVAFARHPRRHPVGRLCALALPQGHLRRAREAEPRRASRDLDRREIVILAPLVVLTILFGIYPKPVLDMSAASVAQLIENYQQALGAAKGRGAGEVRRDEPALPIRCIAAASCRRSCSRSAPWCC